MITPVCLSVCMCVCLSLATCLHYCMHPDVTWTNGKCCALVVHYWADLQLVHGFGCYGNIHDKCEMSARMLVLAAWLVSVWRVLHVALDSQCKGNNALRFSFSDSLCIPRTNIHFDSHSFWVLCFSTNTLEFSPSHHSVLSLIHIWRCRRIERCRSRWSPYH